MGRQRLSRLLLLLIVPLTLLVFSARFTWTQERPSANETPIQFGGLVGQFVAVREAKIRFHPSYENLSLPFASSEGQTPSLVRFRTLDIGYRLPSTTNNALPKLTREMPSASTPTQLSNFAAQFVAVPEAKMRFHPMYENLSLPFAPKQGQTPSLVRFRTLDMGYHLPSTTDNALPKLWQLARTDELQAGANHLIRNTPIEWLSGVNKNNKVHFRRPDPGGDVRYYGHRIPLAGQVILGIGKQTTFRPRVTRVLGVIKPGLGVEKPSLTDRSAGNTRVVGRGPHR